MVTCDGSFGEIPRENYIKAEEKTANQLKQLGKPFVIILNSSEPSSYKTKELAKKTADEICGAGHSSQLRYHGKGHSRENL